MAEIFNPISKNRIGTRNGFLKLNQPSRKTKQGQNCLSYIGHSIWNKLPDKKKTFIEIHPILRRKHHLKWIGLLTPHIGLLTPDLTPSLFFYIFTSVQSLSQPYHPETFRILNAATNRETN